MKLFILIFLFLSACNSRQVTTVEPKVTKPLLAEHKCPEPVIIHDTVLVHDTIVDSKKYDSLLVVIKKKNDSLFIERFRLERVKYYNKIVQKNKSQLKFLSGWINRAVQ
jgi:hypothetical protein